MGRNSLRESLEKRAAWGGIKFRIPSVLLPPKYRKLGQGRDMFLVLDDIQQLRIRWEGCRLEEYHPLTPRQAENLLSSVYEQAAVYRADLRVFQQFVVEVGEAPPKDECPLDVPWRSEKFEAALKESGAKPIEPGKRGKAKSK
ncbi:MAG: hypothetical protein ACFFD4_39935 [Candidatus Odinarchaeota archaeon]